MNSPRTKASVVNGFKSRFGREPRLFRAPARINVIGEHCDYNDGFVMPANTALYTWLAIAPRDDRNVRVLASDFGQAADIDLDDLQPDTDGGWQEYLKGVFHVLQDEGYDLGGAEILTTGEIPLGGGLSSSASLETVTALAMLSLRGQDVDRHKLALMCKRAENEFVGVACGIMDQYVISQCGRDEAMMLDCRNLEFEPAPLPTDARFLVVNSGVVHSLREGGLNERRQECERIVALLQAMGDGVSALRDVDMDTLNEHRTLLGETLYRRGRHVVTEIQRVHEAFRAMADNDPLALGRLVNQSHDSLRNDYAVSCDELDLLVDIARDCEGVYGARMVGAGFGGCTITLVERDRAGSVATEISGRYRQHQGSDPWWHIVKASEPVQEIPLQ